MKVNRVKAMAHLPWELNNWLVKYSADNDVSKSAVLTAALKQYREGVENGNANR